MNPTFRRRQYLMKDLPNDYEVSDDDYEVSDVDPYADHEVEGGGNLISSELAPQVGTVIFHAPLLDLDVPHLYVPSSTPGHGHLYLDVELTQPEYFHLLDVLAKYGIIEGGWVAATKARGYATLRAPGVTKEDLPSRPKKGTDANSSPSDTLA